MDGEFLITMIKMLCSLVFVLLLIYITMRLGGTSMNKLQDGRFIQIVERVSVSKDNSFLIVKLGERYYLATSTHGGLALERALEPEEEAVLLSALNSRKWSGVQDIYANIKRKGRL